MKEIGKMINVMGKAYIVGQTAMNMKDK